MITREQWLELAVSKLIPLFQSVNATVPTVRVSVGFPGGGSARTRIGEHWSPKASDDGIGQIFISPTQSDSIRVLDILVHELVHAAVGTEAGHGAPFKRVAIAVGLTGKMRSTTAGADLKTKLEALVLEIGSYPHGKLNLRFRKKQSTRMVKMECLDCGYICRTSQSNINDRGAVLCPCNSEPMRVS